MKPGLSLRISQHLALTPQLQQSIRLLQLSTLELSQEVEQMLDENPFLERNPDEAPREEFGLLQADAPVSDADRGAEESLYSPASGAVETAASAPGEGASEGSEAPEAPDAPDWEGDGTVEMAPDDGEWGGEAPARTRNQLGTKTTRTRPNSRASTSRSPITCTGRRCRCACRRWTARRCAS